MQQQSPPPITTHIQQPQQPQTQPQKETLPNYKFIRTLGSGTFGKVKAAIHIPSGQNVAIKIIDKKTLKDDDDKSRVERQVQIMKCMRHPNIVQFYEKIQNQEKIYLVCQYAENGELFKLMAEQVRLNQRAAGRIFIQLMNAVEYLHRLGIAHRDLKPENILLDVDYNIKLIDFGLSNYTQKGQFLHTACGSPCYAPPEMVSGNSYQGQIGDLWSMGIIFYGMVCGSLPFQQNTTKQLYKKVIQGFYVIPSDISLEATQVIRKMLITNPKQRITIPQLRKLKFFSNLRQVEPKIIGIIIGFHPMPIDNQIIEKMKKIVQFNRTEVEDEIKQNRHTQFTTLYYLLQKQSLKSGGKTVVDLQYFLQSSQKYKTQYGILPDQFKDQLDNNNNINKQKQKSNQSIRTIKNTNNVQTKFNINNTKGLSKEKRQPILDKKKYPSSTHHHHHHGNTSIHNRGQASQRYEKPELMLNTVKKYKLEKNSRLEKSSQLHKQGKSLCLLSTERHNRCKTMMISQQKQKSKQKQKQRPTNKSKQSSNNHHNLSNSSKKRSTKKIRLNNNNKLAINLWNAYFQKPLQTTVRHHHNNNNNNFNNNNKGSSSGRASKLKIKDKQKQKQVDKTFNQNIQKLKEGFLKLPFMKKNKQFQEKQRKNQSRNQQSKSAKKSVNN